jgi:multicomponent Na+:H+ antiporter subunit D
MIGLPPVAGFISKWYLGIGALQSDAAWVVAVLAGSSLLNAAYLLPLLYRAWLLPPPPDRPAIRELATTRDRMLILPAAVTALEQKLAIAETRLAGSRYMVGI